MNTNTLTPDVLYKMDAYWRAANYFGTWSAKYADNMAVAGTTSARVCRTPRKTRQNRRLPRSGAGWYGAGICPGV
jgi:hypothetical protein